MMHMRESEYRVSPELLKTDPNRRLEIELFGTKFPSPLILGSGTLIEKFEEIEPYLQAGAGAVVPRSTRKVMERKVHPSPHLYQTGRRGEEMMLNAEWTGAAIEYWKPFLESMSATKQVIMSVSGRDIEGCVEVCKLLDQFAFPMIEVNISCAHSNSEHGFITRNGEHIKRVIDSIKQSGVTTAVGLKLGHSDFIVELSQIAKESGADAIVALNTFGPLLDFDIDEHGQPQKILGIHSGKGGMSGAPLFNIALTDVAEIRRQVGLPVIGCGGVRTPEQVAKMMMAGASAVQVYTAAHVRGINAPSFFSDVNRKLVRYMDDIRVEKFSDLKDRALPLLESETNLTPLIPNVIAERCTGCDICIPVCLPKAIDILDYPNKAGHIVELNSACIGCGHCVTVCPTDALKINMEQL